jgi:hypothetical protein
VFVEMLDEFGNITFDERQVYEERFAPLNVHGQHWPTTRG